MEYVRPVNWKRFQHYSKRNPTWIKLYPKLLDEPEFIDLTTRQKAELIMLWLICARSGNEFGEIPRSEKFIKSRTSLSGKSSMDVFLKKGFFEIVTPRNSRAGEGKVLAESHRQSGAEPTPSKNTEVEKTEVEKTEKEKTEKEKTEKEKTEKEKTVLAEEFEDFWGLYPKRNGSNSKKLAFERFKNLVTKEKVEPSKLVIAAKHYGLHCQMMAIVGTQYVQQASTFLGANKRSFEEFESPPEATKLQPNNYPGGANETTIDRANRLAREAEFELTNDDRGTPFID